MKYKIILTIKIFIITVFMIACARKEEPKTKDLVINTVPECNSGIVRIYSDGEQISEYSGHINIKNNGTNGESIEIAVELHEE